MDTQLQITKPQLHAALMQWEQDHRDGKTLSAAESLAQPIDECVAASTERLWAALVDGTAE